jgi:hypothetical protein
MLAYALTNAKFSRLALLYAHFQLFKAKKRKSGANLSLIEAYYGFFSFFKHIMLHIFFFFVSLLYRTFIFFLISNAFSQKSHFERTFLCVYILVSTITSARSHSRRILLLLHSLVTCLKESYKVMLSRFLASKL